MRGGAALPGQPRQRLHKAEALRIRWKAASPASVVLAMARRRQSAMTEGVLERGRNAAVLPRQQRGFPATVLSQGSVVPYSSRTQSRRSSALSWKASLTRCALVFSSLAVRSLLPLWDSRIRVTASFPI